jgi:hypothetical protein
VPVGMLRASPQGDRTPGAGLLLTVADQHILGSVEHPIGTVGGRTLSATA